MISDRAKEMERYYTERGCTSRCWAAFHHTQGHHKTDCALHEDNLLAEIKALREQIEEMEAQLAQPSTEEMLISLSRKNTYVNLEYDDRHGWCVYTRKSWSSEDYVECGTEQDSPLLALRDKLENL